MAVVELAFKRDISVCTIAANGTGQNVIQNNNSGVIMRLDQVSVITSPTSNAFAQLRPPTGFIDTSYVAGTGDTTEGPPIYLFPGDALIVDWTDGPAGGQGQVTYHFTELMNVP